MTTKAATPAKATPKAASEKAPTPTPTPCRCGCGQPTVRAEADYVSGHDARHAGQVGRALVDDHKAGTWTSARQAEALKVLPSERLQVKATGLLTRFIEASDAKAKRAAAREVAKAAYAKALAEAEADQA